MNYTGSMILFIFLVQLAAYTLKWLIGFGNPLISAPLLAMRLDNTLITPGSLLPDLVINGRITWQNRNNFRWRAILPLLLAMVAGVVPGTWLLRFSLPWIIKTVLGGVVVFLGLEMATRRLRPIRPDRREIPWLRYLVAFFSGMCAGLFGINMFLVAYLQRTAKDYDEFKGSICFLFLLFLPDHLCLLSYHIPESTSHYSKNGEQNNHTDNKLPVSFFFIFQIFNSFILV